MAKKREDHRQYVWCLHCECAFPASKWRGYGGCPSKSCEGTFMDRWEWRVVWRRNQDYPVIPVRGRFYPLYG